MTHLLRFDDLQAILHQRLASLPDHRQPSPNTRYTIQDAVCGAFGVFFTQSPSFLEYQRRLQHTKGRNNAQTLFGVTQMPCDNQIRTLLDPLAPSHLEPVFIEVFTRLAQHHMLDSFRVLGDQLLVALDGTNYFASQTIQALVGFQGRGCAVRLSNLILVILSSLKRLFFNGLKKALHYSDNVGA